MEEDPTLSIQYKQQSADSSPLLSRWGDFELRERVGHGGFGEVYRAWDPRLQREVALKLLLVAGGDDNTYAALLREARVLATVRHPNIVSVFGVDRHDGRVGFWTDFIRGRTLSSLLKVQGPFGWQEAALIGIDVCKALGAVHRAGLVHGDVKAQNVMREEGGRIVLIDFGLSGASQWHVSGGTPRYMAPELLHAGQPSSVASDIYAVGILLFHLVTAAFPDTGGKLLLDRRSDLPESFICSVDAALDEEPAKRPETAGALAGKLSTALGTAPAPLPRLRVRLFSGLLAAVMALVAGLFFLHRAHAPAAAVEDLYTEGEKLLLRYDKPQNIPQAIKLFREALAKDPQFVLAEAGIGRAEFLLYRNDRDRKPGTLAAARQATDAALAHDPNLATAYTTRAMIRSITGETALARHDVDRALQLNGRAADAHAAEADVLAAEGRTTDVEPALQKAVDLSPDDWRWPFRLGLTDLERGQPEEATTHLQAAAQLAPDNAWIYLDLGNAYLALGRLSDAQRALQRSIDLQPSFGAYTTLGALLLLRGDFRSAIQVNRQALALNKADYLTWGNLGDAYAWSGDHAQAAPAFRQAIALAEAQRRQTPDDPGLLAALAGYYAAMHDSAHAIPLLRESAILAPDVPDVVFAIGEGYELLHNREEALHWITKAVSLGYPLRNLQQSPELSALRQDGRAAALFTNAAKR